MDSQIPAIQALCPDIRTQLLDQYFECLDICVDANEVQWLQILLAQGGDGYIAFANEVLENTDVACTQNKKVNIGRSCGSTRESYQTLRPDAEPDYHHHPYGSNPHPFSLKK
jgi:hypothetical protein